MTNPLRMLDKAEPLYVCQSAADLVTGLTPRSVRWLFARYAERAALILRRWRLSFGVRYLCRREAGKGSCARVGVGSGSRPTSPLHPF